MNKKIIHTVFENEAARIPGRIAIREEDKSITYGALNAGANQVAHLLKRLGITRENIIAVMMPTGIQLVTALLATFKAGGVYLPADPSFPRKRLARMFTHSAPDMLITSAAVKNSVLETLAGLNIELPLILVLEENDSFSLYQLEATQWVAVDLGEVILSTENPLLVNDPDDGNYIFYTSGSTGEAKAFLGCHKSLSHFIHWEAKEFGIDDTFHVSQLSQFTFDASLRDIFLPLSFGGMLCIPSATTKTNIPQLINWLEEMNVHLVHCVPSLFRLITKELLQEKRAGAVPQLEYILMAGEPLYVKDIRNWQEAAGTNTTIVNLYGTSETTLAKTFHRITALDSNPAQMIHAGRPIDNAAILILNDGIPCATGETGEVYIRTPFMTKGYYNNETLNREVFIENPLVDYKDILHRTGDLGRFLNSGDLEVLGRTDDQVKVNGIRTSLGEIKQAVVAVNGVQDAVINVQQNSSMENELLCYFIAPELSIEQLRDSLLEELNQALLPSFFIKMDKFPLTVNGKIDKKALPKPEQAIVDDDAYAPAETEMEKDLEAMWSELLGITRIGRKVAFFKIGGSSLKAIQLISKVYKKYGVLIKVNDIFSNATIERLGKCIAGRQQKADDITRIKPQSFYEVTHAQKRLWIMDQFQEEKIAYNIPGAFLLKNQLDVQALESAFGKLIARHESLRTVFTMVDGELKCRIHSAEESRFTLQQVDMANLPAVSPEVKEAARKILTAPFHLEQGPLLCASLLHVAGSETILLVTMHHIISDGWSIQVMVKELLHFYEGKEASLPPLTIQYKDYTAWLSGRLSAETMKAHRHYWLNQFEGVIPVLLLPLDHPRPAVKSTHGITAAFEVNEALTIAIREAAREGNVSVYMLLLATLNLLLYHYSGQDDIIVGSPIAGRVHKDLDNQVGLYVNLLAIRTRLQLNASFLQLLDKVKTTMLGAYEHQLYPFDLLVKELHLEHDERRAPLTDIWIQHSDQSWVAQLYAGSGLEITPYDAGYSLSKVDLTFKLTEIAGRIELIIEYNTDLFEAATIDKTGREFIQLLAAATKDIHQPLKDIVHTLPSSTLKGDSAMMAMITESISNEY